MILSSPQFLGLSRAVHFKPETLKKFLAFIGAENQFYRILELGCGTGFFTQLLQQRSPNAFITGLDVNIQSLDRAVDETSKLTSTKPTFVIGDAAQLPFRENTFDLVTSHFFYIDCPFPERVLQSAYAALTHGGQLCAIEPIYQIDMCNTFTTLLNETEQTQMQHIYRKILIEAPAKTHINRLIAPQLPSLFTQLGLMQITIETLTDFSFSQNLTGTQLEQQKQLARFALAAEAIDTTAIHRHPYMSSLTSEEITLLVQIQKRFLVMLAEDPDRYKSMGFFTTMSFLLVKGIKS